MGFVILKGSTVSDQSTVKLVVNGENLDCSPSVQRPSSSDAERVYFVRRVPLAVIYYRID